MTAAAAQIGILFALKQKIKLHFSVMAVWETGFYILFSSVHLQ